MVFCQFQAEKLKATTKEQRDDQQLRQILGESDVEDAKMTKWGSMINLRSRTKNPPQGKGFYINV